MKWSKWASADACEDRRIELEDEAAVRDAFWDENDFERDTSKSQNDYSATIRTAFVAWLDHAHREGRIGDTLVGEVTL